MIYYTGFSFHRAAQGSLDISATHLLAQIITNACVHTNIHTRMTYTHLYFYIHTCINRRTQIPIHMYTCSHGGAWKSLHTPMHTCPNERIHAYTRIRTYTYTRTYVLHVYIYIYICFSYMCIYIHLSLSLYIYIHMFTYIYIYTHLSLSLSIYIHMYVHVYYVCIYIYTYTHT